MRNSILYGISSNVSIGRKESNIFLLPKKNPERHVFPLSNRARRFYGGIGNTDNNHWNFLGEVLQWLKKHLFHPEYKFEPKKWVVPWTGELVKPVLLTYILQLLFISSFLDAPNIPRAPLSPSDLPSKALSSSESFLLCQQGAAGAVAGWKSGRYWLTSWYVSLISCCWFLFVCLQKLQESRVCETSLPSNWIESGHLVQKLLEWGNWHTVGWAAQGGSLLSKPWLKNMAVLV